MVFELYFLNKQRKKMKQILTLGLAFLAMAILPQTSFAQDNPDEKVVKEEKKEIKKDLLKGR